MKKIYLEIIFNPKIFNIKFVQWNCQRPRFCQTYRGLDKVGRTGQHRIRYSYSEKDSGNVKRLKTVCSKKENVSDILPLILLPLLAGHEDVGHLRGCPASSWPAFLGRG